MEGEDVGAQCARCRRRDFLPVECDACHARFCKDCVGAHECAGGGGGEGEAAGGAREAAGGGGSGGSGDGPLAPFSFAEWAVDPRDREGGRAVVHGGKVHVAERAAAVVSTESSSAQKLRALAASEDPAKRERARKVLLMKVRSRAVALEGVKERFVIVVSVSEGRAEAFAVDGAWPVVRCVDRLARHLRLRNPNAEEADPRKRLRMVCGERVLDEGVAVRDALQEADTVRLAYGGV
jgi:hypothetical protein